MKYKIGDKVRIKSIDWYNQHKDETDDIECSNNIYFYREMSKFCGKVMTISHVRADHYTMVEDLVGYWTDEMIEGLVEEETKPEPKFKAGNRVFNLSTKESVNIVEYDEETGLYTIIYDDGLKGRSFEDGLKRIEHITWDDVDEKTVSEKILEARDKHYWDMLGGESKNEITLPQGYQFVDENGNIINAQKIVLEKKKKEYPKTYVECSDILSVYTDPDISGYKGELLWAFQKLLVCRDAYWKIAGEEMGLGKPWDSKYGCGEWGYWIGYDINENKIYCQDSRILLNRLFVFPTEEMRDAFYENFKEEIEICKELL